jgi:outer membrane murein-binding lipoprotein Lpp
MPLVGAAAVTAGAAIYGGIQANKANKRATQAQTHAGDEALNYQKQQDALTRSDKAAAAANWQRQYDAYINRFYGGNNNQKPNGAFSSFTPGPVNFHGAINAPGGGTPPPMGGSMAGMMLGGPAQAPMEAAPFAQDAALTPADTGGEQMPWNDWKRYLNTAQGA